LVSGFKRHHVAVPSRRRSPVKGGFDIEIRVNRRFFVVTSVKVV
jgi:hypothetical protein